MFQQIYEKLKPFRFRLTIIDRAAKHGKLDLGGAVPRPHLIERHGGLCFSDLESIPRLAAAGHVVHGFEFRLQETLRSDHRPHCRNALAFILPQRPIYRNRPIPFTASA